MHCALFHSLIRAPHTHTHKTYTRSIEHSSSSSEANRNSYTMHITCLVPQNLKRIRIWRRATCAYERLSANTHLQSSIQYHSVCDLFIMWYLIHMCFTWQNYLQTSYTTSGVASVLSWNGRIRGFNNTQTHRIAAFILFKRRRRKYREKKTKMYKLKYMF